MAIDVELDQLTADIDGSRPLLQPLSRHRPSQGVVGLDLVIPEFDEEDRIGRTIVATSAGPAANNWSIRLIVIDNGNGDKNVSTPSGKVWRCRSSGVSEQGSPVRRVADGIEVIRSLRQLRHQDLRPEGQV